MSRSRSRTPNDPDACQAYQETFRQHEAECWNDSASNLIFFTPLLGDAARAASADQFAIWIQKPEIKDYIQKTYDLRDETLFNNFVYYTHQYVACLKQRFDNWMKRKTQVVKTRRRKSCVYSKCSAASAIIASEILQISSDKPGIFNSNTVKKLKKNVAPVNIESEVARGLASEAANFKIGNVYEQGYHNFKLNRILNVLFYFYVGRPIFVDEPDASLPIFAFGKLLVPNETIFANIKKLYKTHYINIIAVCGNTHLKVDHSIQLITCANNKQYIYSNDNPKFIPCKWLYYYLTPFNNYISSYYIENKPNSFNTKYMELILRFAAYRFSGLRTEEKLLESYDRLIKTQEERSAEQGRLITMMSLMKSLVKEPDSFLEIAIGVNKGDTVKEVNAAITKAIDDAVHQSIFIKTIAELEPSLIVENENTIYFINGDGAKKLTEKRFAKDHALNICKYLLGSMSAAIEFILNGFAGLNVYTFSEGHANLAVFSRR